MYTPGGIAPEWDGKNVNYRIGLSLPSDRERCLFKGVIRHFDAAGQVRYRSVIFRGITTPDTCK